MKEIIELINDPKYGLFNEQKLYHKINEDKQRITHKELHDLIDKQLAFS